MPGTRPSRKVRQDRAAKRRSTVDRNRAKIRKEWEAMEAEAKRVSEEAQRASAELEAYAEIETEENRQGFVGSQGAV